MVHVPGPCVPASGWSLGSKRTTNLCRSDMIVVSKADGEAESHRMRCRVGDSKGRGV